ncbi:hypothetical protein IPO96_02830 [Candidatus Saccharibacteria bacterium]|nr:MAG: hypothetical protein IPO96_02830 [Candidatus Saccharibacteria bacterium]
MDSPEELELAWQILSDYMRQQTTKTWSEVTINPFASPPRVEVFINNGTSNDARKTAQEVFAGLGISALVSGVRIIETSPPELYNSDSGN